MLPANPPSERQEKGAGGGPAPGHVRKRPWGARARGDLTVSHVSTHPEGAEPSPPLARGDLEGCHRRRRGVSQRDQPHRAREGPPSPKGVREAPGGPALPHLPVGRRFGPRSAPPGRPCR